MFDAVHVSSTAEAVHIVVKFGIIVALGTMILFTVLAFVRGKSVR